MSSTASATATATDLQLQLQGKRGRGGPPLALGLRRFKVWRWMLEAWIEQLGDRATDFDIEAWLLALDQRDTAIVVPAQTWDWLQSEFFAEVQRRGLPMAEPVVLHPSNKRIAGLVAGGTAFLNRGHE